MSTYISDFTMQAYSNWFQLAKPGNQNRLAQGWAKYSAWAGSSPPSDSIQPVVGRPACRARSARPMGWDGAVGEQGVAPRSGTGRWEPGLGFQGNDSMGPGAEP